MTEPRIRRRPDGTFEVERFRPWRRVEHLFAIIAFATLVLTGFPQRYYESGWATWLVQLFGGLDTMRLLHRITGVVFTAHLAAHLVVLFVGHLLRKMRFSLLPVPQDLRDAWENLRYYLGARPDPPAFPKFDYKQKFEYAGILLGGLVMVASGLILMFPALTVALLPGEVIPAARVAHSNEAMLAFLVLVLWHIYGANLAPGVFPFDRTIFTGYIGVEELEKRHRREYERLFPDGPPSPPDQIESPLQ